MYLVLNVHGLRILSTRYIRVILTTNSVINRLVLVFRKRCFEFMYSEIASNLQGLCRGSGGLSPSCHHEDLGSTLSMRKW